MSVIKGLFLPNNRSRKAYENKIHIVMVNRKK